MKFYHGTDQELVFLVEDSFVSKNFRDACKFGYRKAVLFGNPFVYIYMVDIDKPEKFLKRDQNRDRAFVVLAPIKVELKSKFSTYQTPYKLKRFKLQNSEKMKENIERNNEEQRRCNYGKICEAGL